MVLKTIYIKRNANPEPLNSNSGYRNPALGISVDHTSKSYNSIAKGRILLWKSRGLPACVDLLYLFIIPIMKRQLFVKNTISSYDICIQMVHIRNECFPTAGM